MEKYAGVYADLSKIVGDENAYRIYEYFRGQQITFPIRIYSVEYVGNYIRDHYDGNNLSELSLKFGYTERRIRQFLKEDAKVGLAESSESDETDDELDAV